MIGRVFAPPAGSFFLFGPRGTGKSTWLRAAFPDAVAIDLLDPVAYRSYLAHPERLIELVAAHPRPVTVVIHEIQKVPALLPVVHGLIESGRSPRPRFILTGSSSRKLRRSGTDLLAGRLSLKTMHPFMASELGSSFDLKSALRLGMLPLVRFAEDPEETLRSYVALYVKEEVQAEALVRNVGDFARFLEAISFSHASPLNTSDVARECQIGRRTADGFVQILDDLLLGFRVPVFSRRARRALASHPKFYYVDAGVYRSVRPAGPLDTPEEISGAAVEGLVAQHLRAWIAYGGGRHTLSYWRTKAGLEVDFVLYGPGLLVAIEVKLGRAVHPAEIRPLKEFQADYPGARVCLLYGGKERLRVGGILCLPIESFLRELQPGRDLPVD